MYTNARNMNTMIRNKQHVNHVHNLNIIFKLIMNFAKIALKMLYAQEITK